MIENNASTDEGGVVGTDRSWRDYLPYLEFLVPVCLCIVVMTLQFELWSAPLNVPWMNGGDYFFYEMNIQTMQEQGTIYQNPRLGAPHGMDMRDFPYPETLLLQVIQVLLFFTGDALTALNLFYFVGFPLVAFTTFIALRTLKVGFAAANLAALLYAFAPFHFYRFGHLYLTYYSSIPLTILLAIWIFRNEIRFTKPRLELSYWKPVAAVVAICLIQASVGGYYTFFACFFLCISGLLGAIHTVNWRPMAATSAVVAVTMAMFMVNMSPSILYWKAEGRNTAVARRGVAEQMIQGLRPSFLFAPLPEHRIKAVSRFAVKFTRPDPFYPTDGYPQLGLIGSVGLLFLLLLPAMAGRQNNTTLLALSLFTISAILFSTYGGLGYIFNYLVTAQIRCQGRICIYIACLAVFAVAILLDNLHRKAQERKLGWLSYGFMSCILCVGLLDQCVNLHRDPDPVAIARYERDARFFHKLESSLPENAFVYQLPYLSYPEMAPIHQLPSYEPFVGYFHTKTLRWSYGGVRGRESGEIHARISELPLEQQVEQMVLLGADGVQVCRRGYADQGEEVIQGLTQLLEITPMVSEDNDIVFFSLESYAKGYRESITDEEFEARELASLQADTKQR